MTTTGGANFEHDARLNRVSRKPLLTPREGLIDKAQRRVVEQRPPKPQVGGSIPSGPANPVGAQPGDIGDSSYLTLR